MWRNALEPWHIVVVVAVVVVLFGWQKLPDAARSLGRSMRIFKSEVEAMKAPQAGPQPAQTAPEAPVAQPAGAAPAPVPAPAQAQAPGTDSGSKP